jgi:molybdopterin-guanine dinucleotide biosynthesis protein A
VTIAGSILAGGQSRRMGEDKSFLVLGGTPLIERAIDRLRPQVGQLILNVHQDTKELGAYGLPIVEDADGDHQGPLAGLLASLRWAEAQGISWIATAAVDTPFFPKDLVARLEAAAQDKTMAAARSGWGKACARSINGWRSMTPASPTGQPAPMIPSSTSTGPRM